ncbi:VirD4-like conjugal transfer protein, CD1115 family [Paenibacillus campinasensis]|uniref:Conjugation protein n=1 Tax=Paenibacillus campinasensis TaxID=66347 RepID=A0A268EE07_9BACL|nr:type IV secretory system conjugative DNA transfer family protein [Paenibacillus campinasensis]PAD71352.1 conjugation protein [Paenibacillus campinasensis]
MKKKTNVKWISLCIILLIDILFLPSLIRLPNYVREYKIDGLSVWIDEFNLFHAIREVIHSQGLLFGWLFMQFFVLVLILLIFWTDGPKVRNRIIDGVGGPEAAGTGQFGTSRWMTEKEVKQSTTIWKMKEFVLAGGIVLGAVLAGRNPFAYVDASDSNTIIVGATRSGKSRRVILPTIYMLAHAGESMVITDPKGELFDRTSGFLKEKGYKISCLDFRKPGYGNRTNYMEPVLEALRKGDIALATKYAWSIAHMFVYQKPGANKGEDIWRDGPESVIAALILAVAMEAPKEEQKHMYSVYKMLVELGRVKKVILGGKIIEYVPLNEYFESLPVDHPARDAYATAFLAPERTRGSFFSSASALLRLFADPNIAYLTSKQDHDLTDVGKEKTAVYLIIPDEDTTRHPYAALYVNQTYDALVEYANQSGGRLPVRVNMLLDEFGNMPPFPDFDTKLTVSLGRGVRWNMVIQAYGQLVEKYGANITETIKSNAQNTVYLKTNELKTAEELSKKTGSYTVATEGSSYNVGKSSTSRGASTNVAKRFLLEPDEIMRWPTDYSLVLRGGMLPAKLPLPDLSLWPADEEFVSSSGEIERKIEKVEFFVPGVDHEPVEGSEDYDDDKEFEPGSFMDVD